MRIFALMLALVAGPVWACDGVKLEDPAIYGDALCFSETPQRVVVLDPSFGLGTALDTGMNVVGAPLDLMSNETLLNRAEAAGITSIGVVTEPSLEAIVALQPDLILGFAGSESMASSIYPMASQLAPTLLYTGLDWKAFYALLMPLGDREAGVKADLAAFDARLANLRARMPHDKTLSVLRITSWDFQVYMDAPVAYAPFALAQQAGVTRTAYETTEDPSLTLKRPDWEELAGLEGDVLFYIIGGTNSSETDGRYEEVTENPLWQALPAVQSGNVHRVDHGAWMEFNGLESANRVLDDLETYLID